MLKENITLRRTKMHIVNIELEFNNKPTDTLEEALRAFHMGEYDPNDEVSTGNGLDCGYQDEEIIKTEEKEDE
jgi:hypothetical protein